MDNLNEQLEYLKKELRTSRKIINELKHDELTLVYTRQAFLHYAQEFVRHFSNKDFGILAIDFVNFKSANTLYGEAKCNEFLSFVSSKITEIVKDLLIGRFGGDQFVILCPNGIDYDKIINFIEKAVLFEAPIPTQTPKFGIYRPIERNDLMVRCCDRAFLAINEIKGVYGKNVAYYDPSMQNPILDEMKILESMENALIDNQFKVYYQPKHDTVTGDISGAEALVRWIHPEYGFMSPGQFIPLFERNGFITKLDTFILEKVCKDLLKWKKQNAPVVPISVNISRRDYLEPGRIDKQLAVIERHGIDHKLIHMEVTESMYSENTDLIIEKVRNTQNNGFVIEMDDFGAGYSTLGLLSTFPLDVIKLDISFVRNIAVNEIVIENMIKMAHKMGFLTIAEGVETEEQYRVLKGLGCDMIQGYYFSKPLPKEDFEKYLKNHAISIVEKKIKKATSQEHISEDMLLIANDFAEGLPGGFFSYHADDDLSVLSLNKELMTIYECDSQDEFRQFTGNSFKGMVHPDDLESVLEEIDSQIENSNIDYVEYRIITKKGNIKYIQNYGRFLNTDNYGGIFYVFIYDITAEKLQKEAEEKERLIKLELEKAAEIAKTASESKNIFISNLLHDISPIIKQIVSNTEEISQCYNQKENLTELIKKQKQCQEQLLCFINNLGQLSDISSGVVSLNEVPTCIAPGMEITYNVFKSKAEEKNIKFEFYTDLFNAYVYQDVRHTSNVVFNIIQNSIKYTNEGGSIKFALVQEPKDDKECYINFVCEDTGVGISEEFLPHIFEPFTRDKNEINDKILSSGLGMHIVDGLVKLKGGKITIDSKPGKGTKIVVSQLHRFADKESIDKDSVLLTNTMN